ncbi:MAG: hypothetical protein HY898_22305 [Deltaproteobacteria bacterium]|nr:hypothetical protein [Deltaproteobacteria bacterium]
MRSVLGYALPADAAGWAALALAAIVLLLQPLASKWLTRVSLRSWVAACAALAAGLSAFWIWHYLRGGPRIVDATSYWLEARAMSHGMLTWPVQDPTASFRGRFLLMQDSSPASVGVIFPPGFPAVLAVGFLAGAPMAIGPLIAAALVVATAALAKQVTASSDVAKLAALVSALSACLRYHTSDTMSHGLAALCLAGALWFGTRAAAASDQRSRLLAWAGCGLSAGWLLATRPVSFGALAIVGALALATALRSPDFRKSASLWSPAALIIGGALPAALLAVHQHALTGHWLASSQAAYYLASDGPPGCFRYGFGRGIGCLVEHEPYVSSVLPEGYGLRSALITTGRRLHLHLSDVANAEPIALLVIAGAWLGRTSPWVRLLTACPIALLVAYVPFYFDGSYPGGGARLIIDAIAAEHVLIAIALHAWAQRSKLQALGMSRALGTIAAVMLAGFALRASHQHALLRDRDGGKPLYEPALVAASTPGTGLLFVGNDHAFNLAYDPSVRDASKGRWVARARGDDRDRLLWERLGRPAAWRFHMDPWSRPPTDARIDRWAPTSQQAGIWLFEAEAEWPPLAQNGGYAVPTWLSPGSCVSSGVALALVRTGEEPACVTVEVPWPSPQAWDVRLALVVDGTVSVQAWLQAGGGRQGWTLPESIDPVAWPGSARSPEGRWCIGLPALRVNAGEKSGQITVCSRQRWIALDAVRLTIPTPQYH